MSQVLNREINKAAEKSRLREIENLFLKLKENSKTIKQENKQIERLRKANDKSFGRLKQAVENLRTY
jgi:uncharacterized protein YaaN involved in tellurite resistance